MLCLLLKPPPYLCHHDATEAIDINYFIVFTTLQLDTSPSKIQRNRPTPDTISNLLHPPHAHMTPVMLVAHERTRLHGIKVYHY